MNISVKLEFKIPKSNFKFNKIWNREKKKLVFDNLYLYGAFKIVNFFLNSGLIKIVDFEKLKKFKNKIKYIKFLQKIFFFIKFIFTFSNENGL